MSDFQINLRDETAPDDATVLLHLGGSDGRDLHLKATNALKHHDRWLGVLDAEGRFAVSAYALLGIGEDDVLSRMPHAQYGRSTVGQVRGAGFELLPTSVSSLRFAQMLDLQPYHYSILLPTRGFDRPILDSDEAFDSVRPQLEEALRELLKLFAPALRNPHASL